MSLDIDYTPAVARKEKKDKAKKTKPNDQHRELIEWIVSHAYGTWDEEAGRLDTHTAALAEAVEALGLTGDFKTIATGKGLPGDRNCFCYPKPGGVWNGEYRRGARRSPGRGVSVRRAEGFPAPAAQ